MQTSEEQPSTALTHRVLRTADSRWDLLLPLLTRLLVWGLFFGLLTLLSSFFTLIFLTFVFAYLQTSVVDVLLKYAPRSRTSLVILTAVLFLVSVTATGVLMAPQVYKQAASFAGAFSSYMQKIDSEVLRLSERYPLLQEAIPELRKQEQATPDWALPPGTEAQHKLFKDSPSGMVFELIAGGESDGRESVKLLLDRLANISGKTLAMLTTFFLAFLFSFLIVLDLPHLMASVRELGNTHLRFIYDEVADNIYQFGKVLGSAMQAQFYIACVNTVLTGLGLLALGMGEHVAFLSVLVFLFSFVPVAGVFISSVPICLIALNSGGLNLVLLCIGLITAIHLLEGYALNPMIYGARLRINPVIVLIILTVGGKLFGIWGLVLGVPVCTYFFGHAIRYKKSQVHPLGMRRESAGPA